ncbi:MAG: VOC family protein [Gammaproteobacteria bacterium]|nr:VOC family protein [Gammaproteobacteria bacterium]
MVKKLLHASLLVSDTPKSVEFYQAILELKPSENRPDLGYPGAWLDIGEQQIHLIELPNPDPVQGRPEHGGRDRHTALAVTDIEKLQQRLEQHNIAYTKSRSGRGAVFFRDPDGNAIECVEINV